LLEEGEIYDITVERKHFAETLEENLPYYIREEQYEDCSRIVKTISELKNQDISNILDEITKSKK
jgi:hypothetical protein